MDKLMKKHLNKASKCLLIVFVVISITTNCIKSERQFCARTEEDKGFSLCDDVSLSIYAEAKQSQIVDSDYFDAFILQCMVEAYKAEQCNQKSAIKPVFDGRM